MVNPESDSCHLRRIVLPASGFSLDYMGTHRYSLVQCRLETALTQAQATFYGIQGVPLAKTNVFNQRLLEEVLRDAQKSGNVLSGFAFFLVDVFKLTYNSDAHLDYWVVVDGYWRSTDLPDSIPAFTILFRIARPKCPRKPQQPTKLSSPGTRFQPSRLPRCAAFANPRWVRSSGRSEKCSSGTRVTPL